MTTNSRRHVVFDRERARPYYHRNQQPIRAKRVDLPGDVTLHIAREGGHNATGADVRTGPFYCFFEDDNASPLVTKWTLSEVAFQIQFAHGSEPDMYLHRPWQGYQLTVADLVGTDRRILTDPDDPDSDVSVYADDWLLRQPNGHIHVLGEEDFDQRFTA